MGEVKREESPPDSLVIHARSVSGSDHVIPWFQRCLARPHQVGLHKCLNRVRSTSVAVIAYIHLNLARQVVQGPGHRDDLVRTETSPGATIARTGTTTSVVEDDALGPARALAHLVETVEESETVHEIGRDHARGLEMTRMARNRVVGITIARHVVGLDRAHARVAVLRTAKNRGIDGTRGVVTVVTETRMTVITKDAIKRNDDVDGRRRRTNARGRNARRRGSRLSSGDAGVSYLSLTSIPRRTNSTRGSLARR